MKKNRILAAVLALTSFSAVATDYYVVVPLPSRKPTADISVSLSTYTLPGAVVGSAYPGFDFKNVLAVTGDSEFNPGYARWTLASGSLPQGLSLNSDGTLSGVPTSAGTSTFSVQATYKTKTGIQAYVITSISISVKLAAATPTQGAAGVSYAYDLKPLLTVSGDSGYTGSGVSWAVVSGGLPTGLSLSADGIVTGTPVAVTSGAPIQIKATYRANSAQQSYTLSVGANIILGSGGYRTWSDGTLATSCNDYLNPKGLYTYSGATGDGIYRIAVNGKTYDVRCDMSTDGGGWTLLGTQVSGSPFPSVTTDIGVPNGSQTATWRYGNTNVQALQAKQAYRLTSSNPGTGARIDNVYFSGTCVINYADTWNGAANSNSMPTACRTGYTSASLQSVRPNSGTVNASNGIGTNNSGAYCSMRFGASATAPVQYRGALDCNLGMTNTIQLWGR